MGRHPPPGAHPQPPSMNDHEDAIERFLEPRVVSMFSSRRDLRILLPPLAIVGLPIAGLTACGGDAGAGAGASMEVVTDTVDGVERLTYAETGAKELSWALDTTTLIGGYTVEDPDYQFGRLTRGWLASDDAGKLYVFDSDGIRIMGYDASGTLVGQWGREGGGPGEIGGRFGVGAMDVGPGDTLWIADRPNQRFTLIPVGEEGGEPASLPLASGGQPMSVSALHVDSAGPLAEVRTFVFGTDVEEMPPLKLVRFEREAAAEGQTTEPSADTLWTGPPRKVEFIEISSGDRMMIMINQEVFAPGFHWVAFSDGGIAVNDSAAYEIHVLDAEGDTERIIRRNPPPRAVTEEDRQARIDQVLEPPEDPSEDDAAAAERRRERADAMFFADVIPWIVEMRVDPKDRIWVGVSETEPGEVERIDVYERDGTLAGELRDVPMPDFFFGEDGAVILGQDELDVQQIRILRLVEDAEELETVAGG